MKVSRNLFSVTLGSLLLAGSVFAAPASKGTLKLYETVTVQGKQLAPGQYTVEWTGEGPNVQLNIANGKNAVTTPARVVPVSVKNQSSGYSSDKQQDGGETLSSVFFQGRTFEFQIGEQSASQGAQPATSGSNQ